MTSYTKIIDSDLASGALYDKVNDMADALNAGKLEKTSFGLRKASTAYASGVVVTCEYHSDLLLKCTTAGTTGVGALDTSGALVCGNTISDGTVVWTAVTNGTVRSVNGVVPDNYGNTHITIESGWNLLDYKWTDHILNDIRWLRGDTFSWQDGNVYTSAYNALVDDIDGIASSTETVGSYTITYYQAASGRKIVLPAMENTVNNIYNETGSSWYYILDTANTRFKLPRGASSIHGALIESSSSGFRWYRIYEDGWCEQGDAFYGDINGWQNITATLLVPYKDTNYHVSITSAWGGNGAGGSYYYPLTMKTTTQFVANVTNYAAAYGHSTWKASGYTSKNYISSNGRKYLYFYVGNYSQPAVEQTAGLNSSLFNGKMDRDMNNAASNVDCVVESKYPTAADPSWYRLYKSGWIEQGGSSAPVSDYGSETVYFSKEMNDTSYSISVTSIWNGTVDDTTYLQAWKLEAGAVTTTSLTFYSRSTTTKSFKWEIKGVIAQS